MVRTMNAVSSIALVGPASRANAHEQLGAQHRQRGDAELPPPGGGAADRAERRRGHRIERAPVAGDALAEDLVSLKLAQHLFTANLKVLRTQDQMLGTLLDTHA